MKVTEETTDHGKAHTERLTATHSDDSLVPICSMHVPVSSSGAASAQPIIIQFRESSSTEPNELQPSNRILIYIGKEVKQS